VLRLAQIWQDFHQARLSVAGLGNILNTVPEAIYNPGQTPLFRRSAATSCSITRRFATGSMGRKCCPTLVSACRQARSSGCRTWSNFWDAAKGRPTEVLPVGWTGIGVCQERLPADFGSGSSVEPLSCPSRRIVT